MPSTWVRLQPRKRDEISKRADFRSINYYHISNSRCNRADVGKEEVSSQSQRLDWYLRRSAENSICFSNDENKIS